METQSAWDPALVPIALAEMERRLEVLDGFVTTEDAPATAFDPGWG